MESLLANYGSDDEEEEPHQQQKQPTRAPFSAFLPPPKVQDGRSSDVPARKSSLFASLPRPKLAREDKFHFRDAEYRNSLDAAPIAGRTDSKDGVRQKVAEDDFKVGSAAAGVPERMIKGSNGAQRAATAPFLNGLSGARASLFSALPPPKNAGSSVVPLTSQKLSSFSSKRVVEIRPSINMALLQETDDDDDVKPPVKRHVTEGTGLAAILPKPKNLGSALGSGSASGHQAMLDLGSPATSLPSLSESTTGSGYALGHQHATLDVGTSGSSLPPRTEGISSLESTPYSRHEFSTMSHQHASEPWASHADFGGSHGNTVGSWEDHHVGANLQDQPQAVQLNAVLPAPYMSTATQEGDEVHYSEDYYPASDAYSQEMVAHETSAQDTLAAMLMREKRKRNASVNVIEVKQADLTATKLREDQLRTTGIAFGPAYRPMSTGKNKPSKLHRRKHQIGSLYYDMKQKEMELMERRAKGHMTKAETQAKYGW